MQNKILIEEECNFEVIQLSFADFETYDLGSNMTVLEFWVVQSS